MNYKKFLSHISLQSKGLYYKLSLIFGLFFLFPIVGFVVFGLRYDLMTNQSVLLYLLGFMVFALFGYILLRNIFDDIKQISNTIRKETSEKMTGQHIQAGTDELNNIVDSFHTMEGLFSKSAEKVQQKTSEISILKELSELCYVTFDPMEILYVTLERALMLAEADIGSVMVFEGQNRKSFVVKASIGLGNLAKIDDRIDFEGSVAKYAVLNKSPLVVANIETDRRFGRANRAHYGSKSFVCMPIKTSRDIAGVLTISSRHDDRQFTQETVEILTPLLSNAAFTYENLRLIAENEQSVLYLAVIEAVSKILSSSLKDDELIQAAISELRRAVPFELSMVVTKAENDPQKLTVTDLKSYRSTTVSKGEQFFYPEGSTMDKAIKQETVLVSNEIHGVSEWMGRPLFTNYEYTATLLAPLKIMGRINAILVLIGNDIDAFHNAQVLIQWLTRGLSLVFERNNLSDSVSKRYKELDSIRQIGSALSSSTFDSGRVLSYTMDMIREALDIEAGSLYLLKENELEFTTSFGITLETLKPVRLKLGQGIAGHVAAKGEALIVNDVQSSPHFYPEIDKASGFTTRSCLCVPMISQARVIGVLQVFNKMEGDFSLNDKDLLQSVAASVSIALQNAQLYQETVSLAENERGIRNIFQKYVPKEVVDKIIREDQTGKNVNEELKSLTMIDIDIRDFSGLTRKIGPQKTVLLLNRFFSIMGNIVIKHQGIVDKYLGDGFLAIFGAPVASATDVDNAIMAALEMQSSMSIVDEFSKKGLNVSFNIGISIHKGEVVVGNIGFERKMDYTVIGDGVNEVFRLQQLTKDFPNGILISESVMRSAQSTLRIRELTANDNTKSLIGGLKIYELLGVLMSE